jgi:hypothetical protein
VLVDQAVQHLLVLVLELLERDHVLVHARVEGARLVQDVGDAVRHARAEVAAGAADDDDDAARHVLAAVVARALDDRRRPGVANGEPVARLAGGEETAARGAVERGVAEHQVLVRARGVGGAPERADDDLAAGKALAHVVVGLALEVEMDALDREGAEALARAAGESQLHATVRQPRIAQAARNLARDARTHREVVIADGIVARERQAAFEIRLELLDDLAIERDDARPVVACLGAAACRVRRALGRRQQHREVEQRGARHLGVIHPHQQVVPPDDLVERASAQVRKYLPHFLRHQREVGDDLLGRALELGAQVVALRGDAGGTRVHVALPRHGAAQRHQRRRAEAVRLRPEECRHHDVATGADAAVRPHLDTVTQAVPYQRRLRLGQTQFPWRADVLDGRERRGARATAVSGDEHVIRVRLAHARRHRADARLRDELHADARTRIDGLEVADELRQVLDGVDVVMRRRRNELDPRRRMPQARDQVGHLVGRQLAAFARLRACTILISSSSARTRYSAVTPKRADATCLMRLSSRSPSGDAW